MFGIDDALLGGAAAGLVGGLFGGGKQSGTANSTVSIDPSLHNLFYGMSGLPAGTPSVADLLTSIYNTNPTGLNPYVEPKLYGLADRAATPYTPSYGTVKGADVYASAGRDLAPQMTAASTGYQSVFNPFLSGTEAALTQNAVDYLQRGLLPNIRDSAIATGGYGGDRQGIAEGLAAGETAKGLLSSMANLRQSAFESDQSRTLQNALANANFAQQAAANNQQAGLSGIGLGLQARGQDIGQNQFGANLGLDAARINQAGTANAANLYQNAANYGLQQPWSAFNQYYNYAKGFPGNTTTSQPVYSNPFGNALSGFLMGNALFGNTSGGGGSAPFPWSSTDLSGYNWGGGG